MSSNTAALTAGIEAATQKRYSEAIEHLENFCQSCADTHSKDYIQAQMWLVKAYQGNKQPEKAMALCQQMATYENPQVKSWVEKIVGVLSATMKSPTPAKKEPVELFQAGNMAIKQRCYVEAIPLLEEYLEVSPDNNSQDYSQVQMWLVKAYQRTGNLEKAQALCEQLQQNENPLVQSWVQQILPSLNKPKTGLPAENSEISKPENTNRFAKAGRAAKMGVKLAMVGFAGSLGVASGVTLSLLFGMVLVLFLNLGFILGSNNPSMGLGLAIGVTILFNTVMFLLSPILMDLAQNWLYGTRWVNLSEIERKSPETAKVIRQVCQNKKLQQPRLGIIDDENPTAFTYGSLPNTARLVVSKGLFTYLDDEEIATVYAHELGHIVHWDFAVMTLAATLVQITYLVYSYGRRLKNFIDNKKIRDSIDTAATMAYFFYVIGTYLTLYLSRTREYFADRFAAEVTGNPNGLSRALIKIAYGIVEEGQKAKEPSQLIEGTRALGIYDPKAAATSGTAYRIAAQPAQIGKVFLWDMFNPWGWWVELNSTHPLTGKRIRALTTYAEQLGLETEFDMAGVVREGKKLSKKRLYGDFALDLLLFKSDFLVAVIGFALGLMMLFVTRNFKVFFWLWFTGIGLGIVIKAAFMFPQPPLAPKSDVLTLMSDPYASLLRGKFVQLDGELIGRADAGYIAGSDLKIQDKTGLMYLRYASWLGPVGNFFFGTGIASSLIGEEVSAIGWFRRGVGPWVDLLKIKTDNGKTYSSYPRFWKLVMGVGFIILGFVAPALF